MHKKPRGAKFSPSSLDYQRYMLGKKHAYDLEHPNNKTAGMLNRRAKLSQQKEMFLLQHDERMRAFGDPALPSNKWRRGDIAIMKRHEEQPTKMQVSGIRWLSLDRAGSVGSANSERAQETNRTRNTMHTTMREQRADRIHMTEHVVKFSKVANREKANKTMVTTPADLSITNAHRVLSNKSRATSRPTSLLPGDSVTERESFPTAIR